MATILRTLQRNVNSCQNRASFKLLLNFDLLFRRDLDLTMKGHIFNIDHGYLEGLCRGFKNRVLKQADYLNLVQCETLEDLKLHLQSTDYGNFLASVPSPLQVTAWPIGTNSFCGTAGLIPFFSKLQFYLILPLWILLVAGYFLTQFPAVTVE